MLLIEKKNRRKEAGSLPGSLGELHRASISEKKLSVSVVVFISGRVVLTESSGFYFFFSPINTPWQSSCVSQVDAASFSTPSLYFSCV